MYFLNLDFIYYLIYLFFRGIWDSIVGIFTNYPLEKDGYHFNLLDVINYLTQSKKNPNLGDGLGGYDGYSLFRPPHGAETWGDNIFDAIGNWFSNFVTNPYCPDCPSFLDMIFGGFNAIIFFFIFVALFVLYLLKLKSIELDKKEYELYEKVFDREENDTEVKNEKWNEILKLVESENPSDWKMAIINADNLLDELLIEQKYTGESLGERLKSADFMSLQNAWEAHKVRNNIAHNSNYELTKRELKRAIQNYGIVFSEFNYHH